MEIKEVCFRNKKVRALEENNKIYIVIKDICDNLGMNENQIKVQRDKINKDEFLKGGRKISTLPTNGGIQELMTIELDYLPIWLAKINPARFSKELKQELLDYQLKAKDVLAEAFLGKRRLEQEPLKLMNGTFKYNGEVVMMLKDLSDMLGVSRCSVSNKLNKKNIISGEELVKFKNENSSSLKYQSCVTILSKDDVLEVLNKTKRVPEEKKKVILSYFVPNMDSIKDTKHWNRLKNMHNYIYNAGLRLFEEMKKVDESIGTLHNVKKDIMGAMQVMASDIVDLEK